MPMESRPDSVPSPVIEDIERGILTIRGQRVMLDSDLAALYGTSTKVLNQAVKRNESRFPADFAFRLTPAEFRILRSHSVTAWVRTERHPPYVFTEHGAIMAASVLNSPIAVQASVFVVRAFIRLRQALAMHSELAARLSDLEKHVGRHEGAIRDIVNAIRGLMAPPPEPPREPIGFRKHEKAGDPARLRRA